MSVVPDRSHFENVANLAVLLTRLQALGDNYSPGFDGLKIAVLAEILEKGKKSLRRVRKASESCFKAIANRQNVLDLIVENAKTYNSNSVFLPAFIKKASQCGRYRGYDCNSVLREQKVFDDIISLLKECENNSHGLTSLAILIELENKNREVIMSRVALEFAKKWRDECLYGAEGLVCQAQSVK